MSIDDVYLTVRALVRQYLTETALLDGCTGQEAR